MLSARSGDRTEVAGPTTSESIQRYARGSDAVAAPSSERLPWARLRTMDWVQGIVRRTSLHQAVA
jgi:hypothetical protein